MKILFKQFLGQNHSWAVVGQNLARELIKLGHEVDLFPTDGIKYLPEDLKNNVIGYIELNQPQMLYGNLPASDYNVEVSYTAPKNFHLYLNHSLHSKKIGYWAWEFLGKDNKATLPPGFAKGCMYPHIALVPSVFAKQIYLDANIPDDKVKILPHGFGDSFLGDSIYPLKTEKKFKFLFNIGQCHKRKEPELLLESWGQAFTKKDNVALVCKVVDKKSENPWDIKWSDIISKFKKKYPNHAEIIELREFIPDLSSLYRACNAVISTSSCEGFSMVPLEGLASNKIVICPDRGAHLDFCDSKFTLQFETTEVQCPMNYQYWTPSPYSMMYKGVVSSIVNKMQQAVNEEESLLEQYKDNFSFIRQNYTWSKITNQLLEML